MIITIDRMRFTGVLLCFLCVLLGCQKQEQSWELIWSDDFDHLKLDSTVWTIIPRGEMASQLFMTELDTCCTIREGNLILRAILNDFSPTDTATYLTGGIYTKRKLGFSEGRIEIKARIIGAQGVSSYARMLPQKFSYPILGEIGVMGHHDQESKVLQKIATFNPTSKEPPTLVSQEIDLTKYNTYIVEIYEDSLSFYINDIHTFTYPKIKAEKKQNQFPFVEPYFLIINMELNRFLNGHIDPEQLPAEMHIDWVRFYKLD